MNIARGMKENAENKLKQLGESRNSAIVVAGPSGRIFSQLEMRSGH